MNPLAWNTMVTQRMRAQAQFALGALPIGLMFASFVPLFFFSSWLSSLLHIPEHAPVKDQANGLAWLALFLLVMVVLMIAGYLLGWVLNAFVLRVIFRWPLEKVRRLLLYSEIPPSWLKETSTSVGVSGGSTALGANWGVIRKKGRFQFVLQKGVLNWGLPMYLFMAVLPVLRGRTLPTPFYFLWQGCLWGSGGALFGLVIWSLYERSFLKSHGKPEP